jgi:hypothetical protein
VLANRIQIKTDYDDLEMNPLFADEAKSLHNYQKKLVSYQFKCAQALALIESTAYVSVKQNIRANFRSYNKPTTKKLVDILYHLKEDYGGVYSARAQYGIVVNNVLSNIKLVNLFFFAHVSFRGSL